MQRFSSCPASLEEFCSSLSATVTGALHHVQPEVLEAAERGREPGVCVALQPARHYSLSLNTRHLCFRARTALAVEFLPQRGHVGLWG